MRLTLISYGSVDLIFNDRSQFPSFYRTVPNEISEMNGIVQMLEHFGWKWVGILVSDDEVGHRASEVLKKLMIKIGGCAAFLDFIPHQNSLFKNWRENMLLKIDKTTAYVIVIFLNSLYIESVVDLFSTRRFPKKVWIVSSFFMGITEFRFQEIKYTFNGTLTLALHEGVIPGFKDFLYKVNPNRYPDDDFLAIIWQHLFHCSITNGNKHNSSALGGIKRNPACTGNESLENIDLSFYDVLDFRISYRVYTAVYALAHAVHDMYISQNAYSLSGQISILMKKRFQPWQLNTFVSRVHFTPSSGVEMFFDSKGDPPARFDIMKWFFFPNERFVKFKKPLSVCSESCVTGYRKAKREAQADCCYDCVRCSEGEISNTTDASSCLQCPGDQWSNENRNGCIPKDLEFISFGGTLGSFLTSIALILSLTTAAVLVIFIKYSDTPIVKANNWNISCILLLSIMLSFLCTLLFIGHPTRMSCLLRQSLFGIVFTVAVSSVLAKTITVVIAFNATKPRSKLKSWIGTRVSSSVVLLCSSGEIGICTFWMIHSPPFPDTDTTTATGKIILLCNESSVALFFCAVGYMGVLALFSFLVAFLAKDFPDSFNEAKNITFSMLLFCSVWVSFVPAYLSTKGSKTVALEIFAILVSGASLLGCIFIPKCYIILVRSELNTRQIVIRK
ncbi:vomeronasal type-2 receptor 26-like isoform X2 [Ascaphus truei]|uniref:vomeronasal type-2 receptor 26-like isoform X2 n=1 Tax=Ascaphus truei TaxID=8439 RepID=UPI003F59FF7E